MESSPPRSWLHWNRSLGTSGKTKSFGRELRHFRERVARGRNRIRDSSTVHINLACACDKVSLNRHDEEHNTTDAYYTQRPVGITPGAGLPANVLLIAAWYDSQPLTWPSSIGPEVYFAWEGGHRSPCSPKNIHPSRRFLDAHIRRILVNASAAAV